MTVTIRPLAIADATALQSLAIQTFTETFGQDNTPEQLQAYFDEAYRLEVLEAELLDKESAIYGVWQGEQLVAYLKINWGHAQTEQELDNAVEIQRIYVLQSHQGTGLGKQLFELALELAAQSSFDWVWLGVWENNLKAQAFYKKYGFEKFAEHAFPVGDKVDVDWLMKKQVIKEV